MIERNRLFVAGEWRERERSFFSVTSPVTEKVIGRVPEATAEDVDDAVMGARRTFDSGIWSRLALSERLARLEFLAEEIDRRSAVMVQLHLAETGFPVSGPAGEAVASRALQIVRNYLRIARELGDEEVRTGPFGTSIVRREPVGVVVGIAPWNGPFAHNLMKLVPALITGCSVVLKPAPETPLDSFILAECVAAAGIPAGVVSILHGGAEVGRRLVEHPEVDKVSLTGSTSAGKSVAAHCGAQLKRYTLELGGKSAALVFADADLKSTLPALLRGGFSLSGQQCYALSRVLVQRSRYDEVSEALAASADALVVGDPSDRGTEIGPLITQAQQERVIKYIAVGVEEGAVIATSQHSELPDRGWFVRPTVFRDVHNTMRIAQEEIFGPVVCVIGFDDEEDAINIANDSNFGLSGAVFTADAERGRRVSQQVRTGTFSVNGYTFNPSAPFGGRKDSGVGREWGREGLDAYVELKTVNVVS